MRIARLWMAAALTASGLATAALAESVPGSWTAAWPQTDFAKRAVDLSEVRSGGPPKDGIPAIDAPQFQPVADETALEPREAVIGFVHEGAARAYPIRYLMWHEIVNDTVAGTPVAVTYCPLCNAAVVFDRRLDGATLDFGVSGLLRHSDMIMYDRQSESWWQQFTGEAIVGARTGAALRKLPAAIMPWSAFREAHPDGEVMRRPEGFARSYGDNPYIGYDTVSQPWLYAGEPPASGLPMMARVVRVGARAWPLERVVEAGTLTEAGVRLDWRPGMASALDAEQVAKGRDVGFVRVTQPGTGAPLEHEVTFAFVFQAFEPDGVWMMGE